MKSTIMIVKMRYIAIISILLLSLCVGFITRLPFLTQVSPGDVVISKVEVDENGDLGFWAEVQKSNWFDYSGMEYDARWIENENGENEKAIVCCIYKHFRIGGTDNEKKKFLFEVSDLSKLQDVSTVYFGRNSDRILVWKQKISKL